MDLNLGDYCVFHEGRVHPTADCRTLQRHLPDLVNEGYLREFILNLELPSEIRVQRQPGTIDEHSSSTLVQDKKVNATFGNSPMEGTTTKERTIYANEALRDNYPTIMTRPPTSPGSPVSFSEEDAYFVHFPHNDALIVTVHVGCAKC